MFYYGENGLAAKCKLLKIAIKAQYGVISTRTQWNEVKGMKW